MSDNTEERRPCLEDALEMVSVHPIDDQGPTPVHGVHGWFGVSTNDEAIIAYFANSTDAFRYRLDLVNKLVNG